MAGIIDGAAPAALPSAPTAGQPGASGWERRGSGRARIVAGHEHHHHQLEPSRPPDRAADRHAGALPLPRRRRSTAPTPTSTRTSPSCARSATSPPPCPPQLGGWGLDLAELAASQRRLARYAPATALAMSMHSLLDRHRRRARAGRRHVAALDPRGAPSPARCSPPATPRPATTSPCCCRRARPSASTAATASPAASSSAPTARPGAGSAPTPSTPTRPGGPQIVHAFVERDSAGRHRRRDLGHAGHAPDPEPRHRPRRRVRPRRAHRAGRPRRRRQRPVPRRDGDVAAVADRRGVPRHRRPGARAGRRRRPAQDVDGHRARRLRLQPVRPAPGRRDVPRAGCRVGDPRALRRRLGGRRRPRRGAGCRRCTR